MNCYDDTSGILQPYFRHGRHKAGDFYRRANEGIHSKSPAKDLEELLLLALHVGTTYNMHWVEQVKISLRLRIAEEAAKSADTLIEHTEQLTKQTDKNILLTETLTRQNEILVRESQKLGRITWGLFYLTVILALLTAALLFVDWKK